jgi:nicotinamide-nucleotide amidase
MEHAVGELLMAQGSTLGLAESLTGGLVGARITAVPGASRWFRGGIVSYASDVKRALLGVADGPVVSEAAVRDMATGACDRLGADVGLALSGVAGPDGQEGQPVGTVWIGSSLGGDVEAVRVVLPGDRELIRQFAVISGLDHLRHRLLGRR